VQQALDELRGKVTIIAIAHRLSTIRDADRIVVLNHGRIAKPAAHEELMRSRAACTSGCICCSSWLSATTIFFRHRYAMLYFL
jgi:ABC-type multidrug transport system fused ATPase/permease subunit